MSRTNTEAAAADSYEELLQAVEKLDRKTVQRLLRLDGNEANRATILLRKIFMSSKRPDKQCELGAAIVCGFVEHWGKEDPRKEHADFYEYLFRSILSLGNNWKNRNGCECPAVLAAVTYWNTLALYIFAEHKVRFDGLNKDDENLLHLVASNGREALNDTIAKGMISFLLAGGCSINQMSRRKTPLHCAVKAKRIQVTKILVEFGADVNASQHNKMHTPLVDAMLLNWDEGAKVLLNAGASPIVYDEQSDRSPLFLAAERGKLDMVELLLRRGGNRIPTPIYYCKSTVLHVAAAAGHFEMVKKLLAAGASIYVNSRDIHRRTPLHYAAASSNTSGGKDCNFVAVVELLLKLNAATDVTDVRGLSPLHFASIYGADDIVRVLTAEHGGAFWQRDYDGPAPLNLAFTGRWHVRKRRHDPPFQFPSNYVRTIALLMKNLAELPRYTETYCSNNYGHLMYNAAEVGDAWAVNSLLKKGANINYINPNTQCTALLLTLRKGNASMAKRLIARGARLNVIDPSDKKTPLHLAVLCSKETRLALVESLIKAGAGPLRALRDVNGKLPLNYAIEQNDLECVKILFDHSIVYLDQATCCSIAKNNEMLITSDHDMFVIWTRVLMNSLFSSNEYVQNLFRTLETSSNWGLKRLYHLYNREVLQMHQHQVVDGVSLYDYMNMSARRRFRFHQFVNRVDVLSCFIRHWHIILYKIKEAFERHTILDHAEYALRAITRFDGPDVCLEMISDLLENSDLKTIVGIIEGRC